MNTEEKAELIMMLATCEMIDMGDVNVLAICFTALNDGVPSEPTLPQGMYSKYMEPLTIVMCSLRNDTEDREQWEILQAITHGKFQDYMEF